MCFFFFSETSLLGRRQSAQLWIPRSIFEKMTTMYAIRWGPRQHPTGLRDVPQTIEAFQRTDIMFVQKKWTKHLISFIFGRHNLKREETHVSIIESLVKSQCFVDLKHDEAPEKIMVKSWSNHHFCGFDRLQPPLKPCFPWLPRPWRDLPEWCHRSGGPWAAMAPGLTASGGNPRSPGGSCGGKSGEIHHLFIDPSSKKMGHVQNISSIFQIYAACYPREFMLHLGSLAPWCGEMFVAHDQEYMMIWIVQRWSLMALLMGKTRL